MKNTIFEVYEVVNDEYNFLSVTDDVDDAYKTARENNGQVAIYQKKEDGTMNLISCNAWYLIKVYNKP
jgi:hypothetical protein